MSRTVASRRSQRTLSASSSRSVGVAFVMAGSYGLASSYDRDSTGWPVDVKRIYRKRRRPVRNDLRNVALRNPAEDQQQENSANDRADPAGGNRICNRASVEQAEQRAADE